jgi:hypothetical protein
LLEIGDGDMLSIKIHTQTRSEETETYYINIFKGIEMVICDILIKKEVQN